MGFTDVFVWVLSIISQTDIGGDELVTSSLELTGCVSDHTGGYTISTTSNILHHTPEHRYKRRLSNQKWDREKGEMGHTGIKDGMLQDHFGLRVRVDNSIHHILLLTDRRTGCILRIIRPEEHLLVPPLAENLED